MSIRSKYREKARSQIHDRQPLRFFRQTDEVTLRLRQHSSKDGARQSGHYGLRHAGHPPNPTLSLERWVYTQQSGEGVFSRALCCCLCSNCGYCCYDEKRMAEKEKRMKKKRQQMELQQQLGLQEPFYVRSNSNYSNNLHSPCRDGPIKELDSLSGTDNESKSSIHGWSILAPILLCLCIMFVYICLGTFVLYKLEDWSLLDGFYFCFMSLTTIGFGDMVPGSDPSSQYESNTTVWFCSIYIMSGMALTAMCFNVVHDEIAEAPGQGRPQTELDQLSGRSQRQRPVQHGLMTIQSPAEGQLLPQEPDRGDAAQHGYAYVRNRRGRGPRTGAGELEDTRGAGRACDDGEITIPIYRMVQVLIVKFIRRTELIKIKIQVHMNLLNFAIFPIISQDTAYRRKTRRRIKKAPMPVHSYATG
ncbi:hypothetical protein NQ317_002046 [Molorchus minor]|uniref:Potassium channel domain-containing protein n=1 Tax=Molorchus minor TaxID=1323400 RepID=A0ABQ9J8V2_9CUCU|nr:hypothetical protein NQ317_002046 [Molorchus minor]